jgi:hypothetical protein
VPVLVGNNRRQFTFLSRSRVSHIALMEQQSTPVFFAWNHLLELSSRPPRWFTHRRGFMKAIIGCAVAALALAFTVPANAKGCLKGALIGGAAGHYASHHGLLGAAAGCVVGRHEANRRARMERQSTTPR